MGGDVVTDGSGPDHNDRPIGVPQRADSLIEREPALPTLPRFRHLAELILTDGQLTRGPSYWITRSSIRSLVDAAASFAAIEDLRQDIPAHVGAALRDLGLRVRAYYKAISASDPQPHLVEPLAESIWNCLRNLLPEANLPDAPIKEVEVDAEGEVSEVTTAPLALELQLDPNAIRERAKAKSWKIKTLHADLSTEFPGRLKPLTSYGGIAGFAIALGIDVELRAELDRMADEIGCQKTAEHQEVSGTTLRTLRGILSDPQAFVASRSKPQPAKSRSFSAMAAKNKTALRDAIPLNDPELEGIYREASHHPRAFYEKLRDRYGREKVPGINHLGGVGGFLDAIGYAARYFEQIRRAWDLAAGNANEAAKLLDFDAPTVRRIYGDLQTKQAPTLPKQLIDLPIRPGGLARHIAERLPSSDMGAPLAKSSSACALRESLSSLQTRAAGGKTETTWQQVAGAIAAWLERAPTEGGGNWNLPLLQRELAEIYPGLPISSNSAKLLWQLALHGEFIRRYESAAATSGVLTHIGMSFGWSNQSASKTLQDTIATLQGLSGQNGIGTDVDEAFVKEISSLKTVAVVSGRQIADPRELRVLELLKMTSDAVFAELRDVHGLNIRKFIEAHADQIGWIESRGMAVFVASAGLEEHLRPIIRDLFRAANGIKHITADAFGLRRNALDSIAAGVGLDLDSVVLPAGCLLPTLHATREEFLSYVAEREWVNLATLKDYARSKVGDGPDHAIAREVFTAGGKAVSHAELIWGVGLASDVREKADRLRSKGIRSLMTIGELLGFRAHVWKTVHMILERAQPVVYHHPTEQGRKARWQIGEEIPSLQHWRDRATAYRKFADMLETTVGEGAKTTKLFARVEQPPPPYGDIVQRWSKFLESRDPTSEGTCGVLLHRPWYYRWSAERRGASADDRRFQSGLESQIRSIQRKYRSCEQFWVEFGTVVSERGVRRPAYYVAAIDPAQRSVPAIARAIFDGNGSFRPSWLAKERCAALSTALIEHAADCGYWFDPHSDADAGVKSVESARRLSTLAGKLADLEGLAWEDGTQRLAPWVASELPALLRSCSQARSKTDPEKISFLEAEFALNTPSVIEALRLAKQIVEANGTVQTDAGIAMLLLLAHSKPLRHVAANFECLLLPFDIAANGSRNDSAAAPSADEWRSIAGNLLSWGAPLLDVPHDVDAFVAQEGALPPQTFDAGVGVVAASRTSTGSATDAELSAPARWEMPSSAIASTATGSETIEAKLSSATEQVPQLLLRRALVEYACSGAMEPNLLPAELSLPAFEIIIDHARAAIAFDDSDVEAGAAFSETVGWLINFFDSWEEQKLPPLDAPESDDDDTKETVQQLGDMLLLMFDRRQSLGLDPTASCRLHFVNARLFLREPLREISVVEVEIEMARGEAGDGSVPPELRARIERFAERAGTMPKEQYRTLDEYRAGVFFMETQTRRETEPESADVTTIDAERVLLSEMEALGAMCLAGETRVEADYLQKIDEFGRRAVEFLGSDQFEVYQRLTEHLTQLQATVYRSIADWILESVGERVQTATIAEREELQAQFDRAQSFIDRASAQLGPNETEGVRAALLDARNAIAEIGTLAPCARKAQDLLRSGIPERKTNLQKRVVQAAHTYLEALRMAGGQSSPTLISRLRQAGADFLAKMDEVSRAAGSEQFASGKLLTSTKGLVEQVDRILRSTSVG